ncbi:hypothetical protein B0J13DRAFT_598408 [Dactylonectria estremocensis]|uniref:Uncharacterized protein n=1 Tax=Dactylonectria estremocensis TaxID=1079267 RepID=A0A9P9INS1_9HYPO|nr:hypothetical protein B0J13DRAFT_598408 [Dactylonectria estremocensis]
MARLENERINSSPSSYSRLDPILITSRSASPHRLSNKQSRDRVFAALEHGDSFLRAPRTITTADNLDEVELKRCFEILHACALATDPTATLKFTRETMEGFLDAVFNNWTGNATDELTEPIMDFTLREYINVGSVCDQPNNHHGSESCSGSPLCRGAVYVIATYRSRPAQLEIGYCLNEPSSDECEFFCPMERSDIRETKRSCIAKIHKYNKHKAVWHARKMIQGWAKGSISMGEDSNVLSFVKREAVNAAFVAMGDGI